jgi:hypothetical protein
MINWETVFLMFSKYGIVLLSTGAHGSAGGWGTTLQPGRSWGQYPKVSLKFFIDKILLSTLWPSGQLSRNEFQEYFLEDKGCRCWLPYHLHVRIVLIFGSLTLLEPSGPVQGLLYLLLLSTSFVLHHSIVEEVLLWSSVLDLHWLVISGAF